MAPRFFSTGWICRSFSESWRPWFDRGADDRFLSSAGPAAARRGGTGARALFRSRLNQQELMWLAGILKDACRERLEKNLVSQAFEERLYQRGPVEGRLDPRPFLKIWEPRYRKFLDVAAELHSLLEAEEAQTV